LPTAKLHQILAAETHRKNEVNRQVNDLYHKLQKPALFEGKVRSYRKIDDNDPDLPKEKQNVQLKAEDVLQKVAEQLTILFDITATKDFGNTSARADVVVNGVTLIHDAPTTYLLWLEKQLTDLATVVKTLPRHDSSEVWTPDPSVGLFRSEPSETKSTRKVLKNHVKAQATERHAEQVETFTEDVTVGFWETTRFTGALPAARVEELMRRVVDLQTAVKFAREQANSVVVEDQQVGEAVFNFLFAN